MTTLSPWRAVYRFGLTHKTTYLLGEPQHRGIICNADKHRIVEEAPLTRTVVDGYPVSPGHLLVTPRRHVADLFDLTPEERTALMDALWRACERIEHADGFTIGVNNGTAAGQTVMHVHMHLIPRFRGDVPDPRGGIRWVIPEKAAYWRKG